MRPRTRITSIGPFVAVRTRDSMGRSAPFRVERGGTAVTAQGRIPPADQTSRRAEHQYTEFSEIIGMTEDQLRQRSGSPSSSRTTCCNARPRVSLPRCCSPSGPRSPRVSLVTGCATTPGGSLHQQERRDRSEQKGADAGIAATNPKSQARQRLTQMRDFYDFLLAELPALLDRWHRRQG